MGRIVINRTENDQTVILNDTAEGVSGGYFDDEMVWHELGGEGESEASYVGSTVKVRSDFTPIVSSGYDVLPIFAERKDSGVTYQRTYVVYVLAYSSGRLAIEQVNQILTNPVAVEDLINSSGEITTLGESIRLYLPIGIPTITKEMFDKIFIEV